MLVPNLKDGYFVNAYGSIKNQWQTPVVSALKKTEDGKDYYSYMARECRNEALTEENGLISGHGANCEVRLLNTWEGNYIMRTNSLYLAKQKLREFELFDLISKVHCPLVEVEELDFETVLNSLWEERNLNIYMSIEWDNYTAYVPCRYMNYSGKGNERNYLQPQSGQTLFYDKKFFVSYVVAYVTKEICNVEFCVRDIVSLYKSWAEPKGYPPYKTFRRKISNIIVAVMGSPFLISEYGRIFKVNGRVRFYENPNDKERVR